MNYRGFASLEAAHDWFEAEHKSLLRAQILMNAALQKMAEGMTSLELKMEKTTGKLNALLDTVGRSDLAAIWLGP